MKRMRRTPAPPSPLLLAGLLLMPLAFAWSCGSSPLAPFAGAPEALALDFLRLPVGQLNVAGGNFLLSRTDLTIDTGLGTEAFGATWNSATGAWRWSTELTYDGTRFVDASGAVHRVGNLQPGRAFPGTHWRIVDGSRLETKGGLVHRFGSDALLEAIHWSGHAYPELRFLYTAASGARQLVSVEQCTSAASCTSVFSLAYDAAGHVASVTDRANRVVQYGYDAAGELVSARDPVATAGGGPGIHYEYSSGRISAVISGDHERVELAYTGQRLTRLTQVGEENPTWTFSYAAPGPNGRYRTSVEDPLGDATTYFYDGAGHLLELDRPSGATWSWSWSGGRISTATDAVQATTSLRYVDDDPVQITLPSGNVVDFGYRPDAENRLDPTRTALESVSDSLGTILQATYDAAGSLTGITNGAGETRTFTYDSLGELATVTSPSGYAVTYGGYGEHGHPTTISSPFSSTTVTYDAVGDLLQGSSPAPDLGTARGGVVSRSFDADRRLQREVLVDQPLAAAPATSTLQVDRRADGRPLAIRRPYGGDTEFVYDAIGRLVARRELVDGSWQTTTITPDALGRPTSVVRPNGMQIDRTWNADGELAGRSRSRNGFLEASASYGYAGGLLASVRDSVDGGTESYERDASGRPTAIHYASGESLEIQYDLRGREVQEDYLMPGAATPLRTLGFVHDGADRILSVLDDGTPVVTRTYSEGRITRIDYGNGLSRSFAYDAQSALMDLSQTQDGSGNTVESTEVGWGMVYGELWVTVIQSLPVLTSVKTYRIKPTKTEGGDYAGGRISQSPDDNEFAYDALSNVTDRGNYLQAPHLLYNAEHNRLLSIQDTASGSTIHAYAYDAAGFVTRRDGVGISWTADGRLSKYGSLVQVDWDLEGRIVSTDIGGRTTRLLFGGRVEADGSGAPRRLVLREVEVDLTTGQRRYRHYDFRGNVEFMSDSSGSVVQAHAYAAFGVYASYGAVEGARSFAQGRLIEDLVLLGGRLYDTAGARFLSPDPVCQLVNQYVYAMGNPIQFWDPGGASASGTLAIAAGLVTAVGAVAAVTVGAVVAAPVGFAVAAVTLSIDVGLADAYVDPANAASQTARGIEEALAVALTPVSPVLAASLGGLVAGQALGTALTAPGPLPSRLDPPRGPHVGKEVEITPLPPIHAAPRNGGTGLGDGGGESLGGPGGGGSAAGCTAVALSRPGPSLAWLWLLGPLQAGLGAWLLRAWRAAGSGDPREE